MAVVRIGTDNVDLLTVTALELEGSTIDGRGGEDILELARGSWWGAFDFRTVASFAGIERIRGIGSSHSVIFSNEQIQGIKSFENPNRSWFALGIEGLSVDFRNTTLESGIEINVRTDGATFTVNDLQVASMVRGSEVVGETLVIEGTELTAAERRMLHSQGINRVQDKTGQITEDLAGPSISSLDSRIAVSPGLRPHPAAQVLLTEDVGLYSMSVEFDAWNSNREGLSIDESGSVRIESDEGEQRITVDGRVVAQAILSSPYSLRFFFNSHATIADAQEILRSVVYESAGSAMPVLPNKLKIELTDWFQNRAQAEIGIDYANLALLWHSHDRPKGKAGPTDRTS